MIPPMNFEWDGEAMRPAFPKLADKHFVIGETYRLAQPAERSMRSHNQFFAIVTRAWENLPEDQAVNFPTAEDLRARALIACGFSNSRQFVASSKAEAVRIASFIRVGREYSLVTVDNFVVTEFTAQSQSLRAMGPKVFQESKQAVFEYLAAMLGITADQLVKTEANAA